MHKQIGDGVRPDYAVTSQIVKELLEQLDSEWETLTNEKEIKRIANMGLLYVPVFSAVFEARRY
jgi:hypothetical protein